MHNLLFVYQTAECIFKKFDISDLKTVRQVCPVWEDIGAAILGCKIIMQLRHVFRSFNPSQNNPPFNLQLAKNIRIDTSDFASYGDDNLACNEGISVADRFSGILQLLNEIVEAIRISIGLKFIPTFIESMNKYSLSNLHTLKIIILKEEGVEQGEVAGSGDWILPDWNYRPSLKIVRFTTLVKRQPPYPSILQSLVDSTRKLHSAIQITNF